MNRIISLLWLTSTAIVCSIDALAAETASASSGSGASVVEIDGVRISLAEIEQKQAASLFQPRNTYFDIQRKVINEYVDQYLLERQAKKEGLTVTQLLDKNVNNKIGKDPSDEAIRVYYEGAETNESFDVARDKIVQYIRQRRAAKLKDAYVKSLRSQAKVVLTLDPPRAQLSLKDTPVRGDAQSPIMIVEYADYECPYCQVIHPEVEKLRAEYNGKVAYAYKHMPLPMHANAQKAAEAANCAGKQDKFWEYHDILFTGKQLEISKLKQTARQLKLNGEQFDKCLDSGEQAGLIKAQGTEGQTMGLPGTPGFFVNGRFLNGAVSYDNLKKLIEEELNAPAAQLSRTAKR